MTTTPPPPTTTTTTTEEDVDANNNDNMHHIPGSGWTNGAIEVVPSSLSLVSNPSSMYTYTQIGKKDIYSQHRRWIRLNNTTGWTRLGINGHEHDRITSTSSNLSNNNTTDTTTLAATIDDVQEQAYTVRCLIAQLCELFYHLGWATGTGGGCSIRVIHPITKQWRIFVAPSGLQKEDMIGNDMFELDNNKQIIIPPKTIGLRLSACTPLWYIVYQYRPTATCVIHTHSMNAVQATLLDPTEQSTYLRITHLEMLKGIGNHAYDDYLDIPIIDNRPTEDLLASQLESVIQLYPKCNAVLVRRHGIYCWGDTWEQAKTQCESFDYIFDCIIKMKLLNINYSIIPSSGTYREDEVIDKNKNKNIDSTTNTLESKKRKIYDESNTEVVATTTTTTNTTTTNGFNGNMAMDNIVDCMSNTIPIIPRDIQYKLILLDIEGCTTSIAFVKDVLFPYARKHMEQYCNSLYEKNLITYHGLLSSLDREISDYERTNHTITTKLERIGVAHDMTSLALHAMDHDYKIATLKELQGNIWEEGYKNGTIQGHVYEDVYIAMQWFQQHNIIIAIYSSGSIQAQKLLFTNTKYGNLCQYISYHYDITTSGNKKESNSYNTIANTLSIPKEHICFVSDSIDELYAARSAGIGATICSIRPGNVPLSNEQRTQYPCIHSLLQLCGAE